MKLFVERPDAAREELDFGRRRPDDKIKAKEVVRNYWSSYKWIISMRG